jgi:DNA repair protein RecO (recombination protein O)
MGPRALRLWAMALYREQGIVLRTYKLGETDRIVHVLSQGRGKIRAVAKGVRRPGSRFGGRLEPFGHVDLQLYEGRNLDVVNQVELITSFAEVRDDYARSACGSAMVEGVDRVAQESERNTRLCLLLLDGLRALARHPAHPAVVLDAFLLRLASVAGYHPQLERCVGCAAPGPHAVFGIAAGGALCRRCAPRDAHPLEDRVAALLARFTGTRWDDLEDETDARTRRTAGALVESYLTYHLGKPLKAWELVPR